MSRTDTNSNSNSHGHGHTVTDGVIPIEYIDTPDPFIFTIDMADFKKISDNDKYMAGIASELNKITHPRVVLDIIDTSLTNSQTNQEHNQDIFSGGPADLRMIVVMLMVLSRNIHMFRCHLVEIHYIFIVQIVDMVK